MNLTWLVWQGLGTAAADLPAPLADGMISAAAGVRLPRVLRPVHLRRPRLSRLQLVRRPHPRRARRALWAEHGLDAVPSAFGEFGKQPGGLVERHDVGDRCSRSAAPLPEQSPDRLRDSRSRSHACARPARHPADLGAAQRRARCGGTPRRAGPRPRRRVEGQVDRRCPGGAAAAAPGPAPRACPRHWNTTSAPRSPGPCRQRVFSATAGSSSPGSSASRPSASATARLAGVGSTTTTDAAPCATGEQRGQQADHAGADRPPRAGRARRRRARGRRGRAGRRRRAAGRWRRSGPCARRRRRAAGRGRRAAARTGPRSGSAT